MDTNKVGQLTNGDVYWRDNLCVGRFKACERPKIQYESVDHASLGMIAEFGAPSRQLKKMTGKLDLQFLDVDLLAEAYNPTIGIPLTLDAPVDIFGSGGLDISRGYRLTWHMTVMFGTTSSGGHKLSNDFSAEWEYSCLRFVEKASNKSVPLREIDVMAQVNRINGVDVWPRYG
ncbi:MAG: hypothetical protein DI527_16425 [Chelatococcus sp.]|nr:MAG: hypothetical protein DI527_16425 [Chelatococcus sp.]